MKKKGLNSPDFADALAMANYGSKIMPSMAKRLEQIGQPSIAGNILNQEF